MRVLMSTDTVGGVWTYSLELVESLAAHDVDVTLATLGAPLSPGQRVEATRLPNLTLHESAFRLEWMNDPWPDVEASGQWLLELARQVKPHVVHLGGYAHGALPWNVPVVLVAHSCVCSWWQGVWGREAPARWERYRREVAAGLRGADVVVAPTRAMLSAIERHYDVPVVGQVILNGRRSDRFQPGPKEPMVFAAGRLWDEAKNIDALARCAGELSWPVYLAGDTSMPGETEPPSFTGVNLLGRLDPPQVAAWMSRASIYALPARYEPFGLSVLEAALSGCALVLGDIESLREVWGGAAAYVPPGDVGELRDSLNRLIADEAARAVLVERAQARARQLSSAAMAEAYVSLYGQLMAAGRRSRCAS